VAGLVTGVNGRSVVQPWGGSSRRRNPSELGRFQAGYWLRRCQRWAVHSAFGGRPRADCLRQWCRSAGGTIEVAVVLQRRAVGLRPSSGRVRACTPAVWPCWVSRSRSWWSPGVRRGLFR